MEAWQVVVGRGWREHGPLAVRKIFEFYDQEQLAVMELYIDAHLEGTQGGSSLVFYGHSQDVKAVGLAFESVEQFLATLARPEVDVFSLIFVNFEAKLNSSVLADRPESTIIEAPTVLEGLQHFLQAIVESIQGEGARGICEWAMITCTRQPQKPSP